MSLLRTMNTIRPSHMRRQIQEKNLVKILTENPTSIETAINSNSALVRTAAEKAVQNLLPSDSEVLSVINNQIAMPALQAPLTSAMQQQYLSQYKSYIGQGMTPDQAFDQIAAEFVDAAERGDTAFYESRTGVSLSNGNGGSVDPALLPYVQKTGGASGGNKNLLIYAGIAAAGLFLLFGNKKKGKGLSGTAKKRKTSARKTQRIRTTKKR